MRPCFGRQLCIYRPSQFVWLQRHHRPRGIFASDVSHVVARSLRAQCRGLGTDVRQKDILDVACMMHQKANPGVAVSSLVKGFRLYISRGHLILVRPRLHFSIASSMMWSYRDMLICEQWGIPLLAVGVAISRRYSCALWL